MLKAKRYPEIGQEKEFAWKRFLYKVFRNENSGKTVFDTMACLIFCNKDSFETSFIFRSNFKFQFS